jgi:HEAT repeat protein
MAATFLCPHCRKAYAMKPELAGKKVRCRQCNKPFGVAAAAPPGDDPIVLSDLPTPPRQPPPAAPSPSDSLWNLLDQELTTGPTFQPGQAAPGAGFGRRAKPVGSALLGRLQERRIPTVVAVVAMVFLLLGISFREEPWWVIPLAAGGSLAALGFWVPPPRRRGDCGPWILPVAGQLAGAGGVFGLLLLLVFGLMAVAGLCGHPIPPAMGMSPEAAVTLAACHIGAIVICFAFALLMLLVSLIAHVVREFGFLLAGNILYLCLAVPLLVCLSPWVLQPRGGWRIHGPLMHRPSSPAADDLPNFRPHWPPSGHAPPVAAPGVSATFDLPPGAADPNHPDFYRVNLAELRSPEAVRRRLAAARLAIAPPKELRDEISAALVSLLGDRDIGVRTNSLQALNTWYTGDVVELAINALEDKSVIVRDAAVQILENRKDPRAIEPLVGLLIDWSDVLIVECLQSFGAKAEDPVLARYNGAGEPLRRAIIEILAEIATEKGIAKLREIAEDRSHPFLQSLAKGALLRRSMRGAGPKGDDPGTPDDRPHGRRPPRPHDRPKPEEEPLDPVQSDYYEKLAERMQSDDFVVRRKAVEMLLNGEPDKAKTATRKQIGRRFSGMAQDENGDDQRKAVRGCAMWAGNDGVPTLVRLLGRDRRFVHEEVLQALGPLKDKRAAIPVANLLGDPFDHDNAYECLRQMGETAEDGLLKVVYSPNPKICLAAIDLMGESGTARCLPALRDGLRSPNPDVREAGREAIRKITEREKERKDKDKEEGGGKE